VKTATPNRGLPGAGLHPAPSVFRHLEENVAMPIDDRSPTPQRAWPEQLRRWLGAPAPEHHSVADTNADDRASPAIAGTPAPHWPRIFPGI
jgi:hypothetical protein